MLASVTQTFGVILIVAAAVGYAGLLVRKALRQPGGCCGSRGCGAANRSRTPGEDRGATPFVSTDQLTDRARQLADNQRASGKAPPPT
jgi:hypothetical protein